MRRLCMPYIKAKLALCLILLYTGSTFAQTKDAIAVKRESYIYSGVVVNYPAMSTTNEDPLIAEMFAGALKVRTAELIEHGDSLMLKMEFYVRQEAINKRQSWAIIPQLTANDGGDLKQITFPYALVNGSIREKIYKRKLKYGNKVLVSNPPCVKTDISKRSMAGDDMLLHYTVFAPYEPWMDYADLQLNAILVSPTGKRQLLTVKNAGRVKFTPRIPYEVDPYISFIEPAPEEKQRKMQGQAYLDFQVGRSVIIPTFRRNPEELDKIAYAVAKIKNNLSVQITGLFIEGYASPEGSYALNERLSHERANALMEYMVKTYGLGRELFRVNSVAEDWDGLADLINASTIKEREEVLDIIHKTGIFDGREAALMRLNGGRVFQMLKTDFFPQLRRVEYQIDFAVKDYSIEESQMLAGRNPELLSQRELYLLAMSYAKGSHEREQTFEQIRRLYPNDPVAIINEAATMLQHGEYTGAKRLLERVSDNPKSLNNMGVCLLMEGEFDKATEYFERAVAQGFGEATHNLEELRKKREDNKQMKRVLNR